MDLIDIKEFFKDIIKYIITAFIVIVIFLYVVSLQQVIGPSMSSTLQDGDIAILNKIGHRFFDIERNEVVSLDYDDTKYLIKRVIGLPGDKIEYKDNVLYINGESYKETFLDEGVTTDDFSIEDLGYDTIPEDMYLVLGDNRNNSMDSREIGLIKKEDIKGKVFFRIWPLNKISFIN